MIAIFLMLKSWWVIPTPRFLFLVMKNINAFLKKKKNLLKTSKSCFYQKIQTMIKISLLKLEALPEEMKAISSPVTYLECMLDTLKAKDGKFKLLMKAHLKLEDFRIYHLWLKEMEFIQNSNLKVVHTAFKEFLRLKLLEEFIHQLRLF